MADAKTPADQPAPQNKPAKRLTLGGIAEELGVSTATVSLALRDSPLIAQDTREKVKATARRLGYIYNRSAASLRTAKSHIVGVAVHDIMNPYFAEIFTALEDVLEDHGQMVFICCHRDSARRQRAFIETLQQHRADGLILCPSVGTTAEEINQLVDQGLPVTIMCREVPGTRAPCVRGNDEAGGYAITRHLIEQGHRQIAMIGGRTDTSPSRDRLTGWKRALGEAGLAAENQLYIPELMTQADARAAVPRILDAPQKPTALIGFNDLIAFGLMGELRQLGVVPGRDIAVTGYDDIDGAANRSPSLTTIDSFPEKLGPVAARTLLGQIDGRPEPDTDILIEPEIRVRESTPPPRKVA